MITTTTQTKSIKKKQIRKHTTAFLLKHRKLTKKKLAEQKLAGEKRLEVKKKKLALLELEKKKKLAIKARKKAKAEEKRALAYQKKLQRQREQHFLERQAKINAKRAYLKKVEDLKKKFEAEAQLLDITARDFVNFNADDYDEFEYFAKWFTRKLLEVYQFLFADKGKTQTKYAKELARDLRDNYLKHLADTEVKFRVYAYLEKAIILKF